MQEILTLCKEVTGASNLATVTKGNATATLEREGQYSVLAVNVQQLNKRFVQTCLKAKQHYASLASSLAATNTDHDSLQFSPASPLPVSTPSSSSSISPQPPTAQTSPFASTDSLPLPSSPSHRAGPNTTQLHPHSSSSSPSHMAANYRRLGGQNGTDSVLVGGQNNTDSVLVEGRNSTDSGLVRAPNRTVAEESDPKQVTMPTQHVRVLSQPKRSRKNPSPHLSRHLQLSNGATPTKPPRLPGSGGAPEASDPRSKPRLGEPLVLPGVHPWRATGGGPRPTGRERSDGWPAGREANDRWETVSNTSAQSIHSLQNRIIYGTDGASLASSDSLNPLNTSTESFPGRGSGPDLRLHGDPSWHNSQGPSPNAPVHHRHAFSVDCVEAFQSERSGDMLAAEGGSLDRMRKPEGRGEGKVGGAVADKLAEVRSQVEDFVHSIAESRNCGLQSLALELHLGELKVCSTHSGQSVSCCVIWEFSPSHINCELMNGSG